MRALARFPDDSDLRVIASERPTPDDGEVLVRTLAVGIDGSDRRIAAGEIGGDPPAGDDHLVLGHEAVGVVETSKTPAFETGDVVVPMVRRPADPDVSVDELDMAPPDTVHECGIFGAHGFAAEFFVADPTFLVPVPPSLADYGFFVEPASIVEKSMDQAMTARSGFDWQPSSAMVLGTGNLGLLAAARLATGSVFDDVYGLGRRDRPDPTIAFLELLDATYVDIRETAFGDIPEVHDALDYIFEATGYPPHSVEATRALAPNGVLTLQGIPTAGDLEFAAGEYHADLVVANKAVLGVVNARRAHFAAAVDWLDQCDESLLDALVTGVYDLGEFEQALADDEETCKTVIAFDR